MTDNKNRLKKLQYFLRYKDTEYRRNYISRIVSEEMTYAAYKVFCDHQYNMEEEIQKITDIYSNMDDLYDTEFINNLKKYFLRTYKMCLYHVEFNSAVSSIDGTYYDGADCKEVSKRFLRK